jgi:hypothetical protein
MKTDYLFERRFECSGDLEGEDYGSRSNRVCGRYGQMRWRPGALSDSTGPLLAVRCVASRHDLLSAWREQLHRTSCSKRKGSISCTTHSLDCVPCSLQFAPITPAHLILFFSRVLDLEGIGALQLNPSQLLCRKGQFVTRHQVTVDLYD